MKEMPKVFTRRRCIIRGRVTLCDIIMLSLPSSVALSSAHHDSTIPSGHSESPLSNAALKSWIKEQLLYRQIHS